MVTVIEKLPAVGQGLLSGLDNLALVPWRQKFVLRQRCKHGERIIVNSADCDYVIRKSWLLPKKKNRKAKHRAYDMSYNVGIKGLNYEISFSIIDNLSK